MRQNMRKQKYEEKSSNTFKNKTDGRIYKNKKRKKKKGNK